MRHKRTTRMAVIVMTAVAMVACDTGSELTDSLDPQAVEAGAGYAGMIRASTEAAERMIFEIAAQVAEVTTSPAAFDLGNGISGTVSRTETGGSYSSFAGTIELDGATVPVRFGRLALTPAPDQPAGGSEYQIMYRAEVQDGRWEELWQVAGTAVLDATGNAGNYELTRTIRGVDSPATWIMIRPSRMDVVITTGGGWVLRFAFDRTTPTGMQGTVTVNGLMIGAVTIASGCAHVDYVDERWEDADVCFVS